MEFGVVIEKRHKELKIIRVESVEWSWELFQVCTKVIEIILLYYFDRKVLILYTG